MPLDRQSEPRWRILEGDCRDQLATLDAGCVQTCVTSPPYFGLRDYGHDGQIGLEPTPNEFVAALVEVLRGVRRVLRDDGTVWLNLGDSYASGDRGYRTDDPKAPSARGMTVRPRDAEGIKPKDLLGIPWMVAFALRADGWYLRSDIIWAKPNPMPESVTDRPTKAHEYLFLLSKSPRYFYAADAIREPHLVGGAREANPQAWDAGDGEKRAGGMGADGARHLYGHPEGRNKRSVWSVATQPFPGAHFATFPPKLIEPCILAGSRAGDIVLDPFSGAGTTGMVALRHGRSYIGCELNPEYVELSRGRIIDDCPMWNTFAEAA